jgi:hypothetical protein
VPLAGSTPPGVIARPDNPPSSTTTSPVDPLSRTVPDPPTARTQHSPRPARPAPVRHTSSDGAGSISRPVLAVIAVGVLILVALGGWGLSRLGGGGGGGSKQKAGASSSPVAKPTAEKLKPARAIAFNRPPHPDSAATSDLDKAIDPNKSSAWTTQHYGNAHFGGYRPGIGLVIDMGKSVTVSKVKVTMPQANATGTVELHIGDSGDANTPLTDTGSASGSFDLNGKNAKGRYVTLWFTKLPNIGEFRAVVRDVAVYGTG